jgi:hypothetical protein
MRVFLSCLLLCLAAVPLAAQAVPEKSLPLNGTWDDSGAVLTLDWQDAKPLRVGPVDVNRRRLGETGGLSWKPVVQDLQRRYFFKDLTPEPGVAYEYQVIRKARDIVDVGYWLAGNRVPAVESRGHALLVIDEIVAEPLAARIDRFERDLIGDGWQVTRHLAPRHDGQNPQANLAAGRALRQWITTTVESNRDEPHSLILLGRVPVVESGSVAPDGHESIPHATDLFYADIGRRWPDAEAGKLRPSTLPDLRIDMTVGRIDFVPVAGQDKGEELRLLARYLDKNHHWRHGRLGDLRNAYGQSGHLLVEQNALRNVVGADAITAGGHHDAGVTEPYLWGVDFGRWKGDTYRDAGIKPVFSINFGSHKQKFARGNNPMTWMLAQDWYPLAVGWGGRPAWFLHLMALGGTVGEMHMRTVNNGPWNGGPYRQVLDYYPMGSYLWRAPIWVNLLGDPTLHAFPLLPPREVRAKRTGDGVVLTWALPEAADVEGVRVFRAASWEEPFAPVSEVLAGTTFTDPEAPEGAIYMLRSYGLKTVHAGTFYSYAQGVFTQPGAAPPGPVMETVNTASGEAVTLPDHAGLSFIEGPGTGLLRQAEGRWVYTPPDGFVGTVQLRNAVSNDWGTTEGTTTVTVGD